MTSPLIAIGNIAEFINGVAFREDDWTESGRPIIRIQNLNDSSKPFNRTTRNVADRNLARSGDILVSWAASLGVYEWRGEEACVNQHIFKVIPDLSRVERAYLLHALRASIDAMQSQMHGATMKHITREKFLRTTVLLPSIAEQRRIAAILDKADTIRAKRREAIAKLDQLLQSVFLDMFGDPVTNPMNWPRVPLAQILDRIESGASPVCLDRPANEVEWAVLKLGAVTRCVFDAAQNKAMNPSTRFDSSLEVRPGDLLFSRKNTYSLVAACALVERTPTRLLIPDLIFRLVPKPEAALSKVYLHALLTYPSKRSEIQKLAGGSAGSMPNISKAKLLQALVELPPIDMQRQFEARLSVGKRIRAATLVSESVLERCASSIQSSFFPN